MTPPANWPATLEQAQWDEEWVVYDVQTAWAALPPSFQSANQQAFNEALSTLAGADAVFIQAGNAAVAASSQNYAAMIAAIVAASTDFVNVIETLISELNTASSEVNPATVQTTDNGVQASLTDALEHLKDMQSLD